MDRFRLWNAHKHSAHRHPDGADAIYNPSLYEGLF